jgi:hypothetical protein
LTGFNGQGKIRAAGKYNQGEAAAVCGEKHHKKMWETTKRNEGKTQTDCNIIAIIPG